LNYVI